jgi:TM2 domain-containing membrane protein YozV
MKNKYVAALLAFFLGSFGVHRFYLGQIGLGVMYCLLFKLKLSPILGFIDAVAFLIMSDEAFNRKYNQRYHKQPMQFGNKQVKQSPYYAPVGKTQAQRSNQQQAATASNAPTPRSVDAFRQSGLTKFKAFDLPEAIIDFERALAIAPKDIATHFNLACAYSLNEKATLAYYHLDQAVKLGFSDWQKIDTQDSLSFLRATYEWPTFKAAKFRLPTNEDHSHLLDQLAQLRTLRDAGKLTQDDFERETVRMGIGS